MEVYEGSMKKFSMNEMYSIEDLRTHYQRASKKATHREGLSDPSGLRVIVYLDAEETLHFWNCGAVSPEWTRMAGISDVHRRIGNIVSTLFCSQVDVVLVVNPKSSPEIAEKIVRMVQGGTAQTLTLFVGRIGTSIFLVPGTKGVSLSP